MQREIPFTTVAELSLNGIAYPCMMLNIGGREIYRITTGAGVLHIAKAKDSNGHYFWTSIPENKALASFVISIGKQIDLQLKTN